MENITKIVSGGYFKIGWNIPVHCSYGIQDYWEGDENGFVCQINIQLLHNSDSNILIEEPEIIKLLHKQKIKKTKLVYSDFLIDNESLDNIHQSLFQDYIIFSYQNKDEYNDSFVFKELTKGVFIVFDDEMILSNLIIDEISTFKYINIDSDLNNLDNETRQNLIKLYFKIYTYNQNNDDEIKDLINEIKNFLKNTPKLDSRICDFFKEEESYLWEELE